MKYSPQSILQRIRSSETSGSSKIQHSDVMFEPICMRYGIAPYPKELLKLHLEQMKKGNSPISEKVILIALEKIRVMKNDTEIRDILYAITDLSPHQSVRDKAREFLS